MLSSSQDLLKEMLALSPTEEQALKRIEETMANSKASPQEKSQVIEWLSRYPVKLLYAFSRKNPKVNELFEKNPDLNQCWSTILEKYGYPCHQVISFDKSKRISNFTLLKAVALLSQLDDEADFNNHNMLTLLNEASQFGLFDALMKRLNFYDEKLTQMDLEKADIDDISRYVDLILHDATQISNLYWSVGCMNAGIILLNLSDYFLSSNRFQIEMERFLAPVKTNKFSWFKSYDDTSCPYPILLLESALENIYLGLMIAKMPQSKIITYEVAPNHDLYALFEEGIASPADVQTYLKNNMESLNIPLIDSLCTNAFNRALKSVTENYHDVELPYDIHELTTSPSFK